MEPERTEAAPTDEDPDAARTIEAPRVDQEIFEAFPNEPTAYGIDPADGLPSVRAAQASNHAYAPPLDPSTLICMADVSRFVLRNAQREILAEFEPSAVTRRADGQWYVPLAHAADRMWVKHGWRATLDLARLGVGDVAVEPIRPQCRHYARQMTDFQDDPDAKFVARLCTARRTDDGEFLSVRDAQIHACELRVPYHAESTVALDRFDAEKIALGRSRTREVPDFSVADALTEQGPGIDPWGDTGIFG